MSVDLNTSDEPQMFTVSMIYVGDDVTREWLKAEREMERIYGCRAWGCYFDPPGKEHWKLESIAYTTK